MKRYVINKGLLSTTECFAHFIFAKSTSTYAAATLWGRPARRCPKDSRRDRRDSKPTGDRQREQSRLDIRARRSPGAFFRAHPGRLCEHADPDTGQQHATHRDHPCFRFICGAACYKMKHSGISTFTNRHFDRAPPLFGSSSQRGTVESETGTTDQKHESPRRIAADSGYWCRGRPGSNVLFVRSKPPNFENFPNATINLPPCSCKSALSPDKISYVYSCRF